MSSHTFKSIFSTEFQSLVELKQSAGFKYENGAACLRRLDLFLHDQNLSEKALTKETCDRWCRKRSYESLANQASRISTLRVFCHYLCDIGLRAYVPPKGMSHKPPKYDAHIYTDDELSRFFRAVDKSRSVPSECPYRADVMPVFFRILYTSGMRVSELRLVKVRDVNTDENFIAVYNAKNSKDRIVPIHPHLADRCAELKKKIHSGSSDDEYFFMIRSGQPMPLVNVYKNFRRYLEKAGIPHTGRGPRVHDFRFTYCVNLLRKWADEERDLIAWLPYMRTMLGHETFEETAYYLKLTSERFPYIKDRLKSSFPDIIKETVLDEHEFY